jgi:hypothetical protein
MRERVEHGLKKCGGAICSTAIIYRSMPEVSDKFAATRGGQSCPRPLPARVAQAQASDEQPYTGGDIWLVEGTTGKTRLCKDYDVAQLSCRVWARTVSHSSPKKKAAASGETSHTAASAAPAIAVAEIPRKEKSQ